MKKPFTKLLMLLVVFCMVFSSLGTTAFAETEESRNLENIEGEEVPLVGNDDSWSMLNFLLMLATVGTAVFMVVTAIRRREEEGVYKRTNSIRLVSLLPAFVSLIVFLFTEKLSGVMVFANSQTMAMFSIAMAQGIVIFSVYKSNKDAQVIA